MTTPILDFLSKYRDTGAVRAHMPGHKGKSFLGFEDIDVTEITNADSLYHADGIIKESEACASKLFGSATYYSTEGSSQVIRAMLSLVTKDAARKGTRPLVLAARNVHRSFISAAALLDIDVEWISLEDTYLSSSVSPENLRARIAELNRVPTAVYVTTPDYLGNLIDVKALSSVCAEYSTLLLVDNAHGAYLRFLESSLHPIDLGADMCSDSAHKTLPALTGAAYMHLSNKLDSFFFENAKDSLSLFGSSSPSYLILASLDRLNSYVSNGYAQKLCSFTKKVAQIKEDLTRHGYSLIGDEPLKITIKTKGYGYEGTAVAKLLEDAKIYPEFADSDYLVLMITPENTEAELLYILSVLKSVRKLSPIPESTPKLSVAKRAMSIREAIFADKETISTALALGRIYASHNIPCPPAVPILMPGEIIDESAIEAFNYYGYTECTVVKND